MATARNADMTDAVRQTSSPIIDPANYSNVRSGTAAKIFELLINSDTNTVLNQSAGDAQAGSGYVEFLADPSNGSGAGINGTNISVIDISDDSEFPSGTKGLRIVYQGGGTAYSFGNQTIFMKHDELSKFYMRVRVKFSANWEWGNDQLKFCKNKGTPTSTSVSTNCPKFNGSGIAYLTKLAPANTALDDRAIYAVNPGADGDYAGSDDIVNDFGGAGVDANWTPTLGQWHEMEWEIDAGTKGVADGSYKVWIDGNLYMQLDNVQVAEAGDTQLFSRHELGHVWQTGSPTTDITVDFSVIEIYDGRPT